MFYNIQMHARKREIALSVNPAKASSIDENCMTLTSLYEENTCSNCNIKTNEELSYSMFAFCDQFRP